MYFFMFLVQAKHNLNKYQCQNKGTVLTKIHEAFVLGEDNNKMQEREINKGDYNDKTNTILFIG